MSLTDVFPTDPVMPTTWAPELAPPLAGRKAERRQRVGRRQHPAALQALGVRWGDQGPPGARLQRRRRKAAPVDVLAGQADE